MGRAAMVYNTVEEERVAKHGSIEIVRSAAG